jgi:hypothetical protein
LKSKIFSTLITLTTWQTGQTAWLVLQYMAAQCSLINSLWGLGLLHIDFQSGENPFHRALLIYGEAGYKQQLLKCPQSLVVCSFDHL